MAPTLFNILFVPLFLVLLKDIPCDTYKKAAVDRQVLNLHQLFAKVKIIKANTGEWLFAYSYTQLSCISKSNSVVLELFYSNCKASWSHTNNKNTIYVWNTTDWTESMHIPPFVRCSSSLKVLNFGSISFQNASVAEDTAECTSIVIGKIQCNLWVTSVIFICDFFASNLISDVKKSLRSFFLWRVQIKNSSWKRKINIQRPFPD